MISLEVNGKRYEVDVSREVPLLWVLREYLKLTGTKFGCGASMRVTEPGDFSKYCLPYTKYSLSLITLFYSSL